MAKEIRWSVKADNDRIEILEYWIKRNKSSVYSNKLNNWFTSKIGLLSTFPELGKATNIPSIRIKIIREYSIYYQVTDDYIEVLTIWHNKRDPQKFEL